MSSDRRVPSSAAVAGMRERLEQLRAERERGERQLELLDRRRAELRDTLLRIAGAIQVLEELQARPEEGGMAAAS